jgi:hypothetical protein
MESVIIYQSTIHSLRQLTEPIQGEYKPQSGSAVIRIKRELEALVEEVLSEAGY